MSLVPMAMVTSVTAGIAGIIVPPLAPIFGLPAFGILYYIVTVAKLCASLPYANIILPPFRFGYVLGMYMFLVVTLLRLKSASR